MKARARNQDRSQCTSALSHQPSNTQHEGFQGHPIRDRSKNLRHPSHQSFRPSTLVGIPVPRTRGHACRHGDTRRAAHRRRPAQCRNSRPRLHYCQEPMMFPRILHSWIMPSVFCRLPEDTQRRAAPCCQCRDRNITRHRR